jgi:glucan 1,3-beta-glucosidase
LYSVLRRLLIGDLLTRLNRPDTDSAYDVDYAALKSALSDSSNAGAVYAITVGSEALYRKSLTADALLSKIQNMSSTFPNIKIGTADSWNKFQDGTADPIIKGGVKLLYGLSIHSNPSLC